MAQGQGPARRKLPLTPEEKYPDLHDLRHLYSDGRRIGHSHHQHDGRDSPHLVQLAGTGVVEADLGLTMGAGANPVRSGSDLTYAITVSNAGPTVATDVIVADVLPTTHSVQQCSPSAGCACTTPDVRSWGMVRCRAVTLAKGAQGTIQLVVKVVGPGGCTLSNTATVASTSTTPNHGQLGHRRHAHLRPALIGSPSGRREEQGRGPLPALLGDR